jgi:adenylyltransferase/sulfurtransferase
VKPVDAAKMIHLSPEELLRYNRQIILPDFGLEGQKKLKASRVLVIGCGGLGSPVILYLAAAGAGTLGLVEYDTVDKSNLHRQILYNSSSVGKSKLEEAASIIAELNPFVKVEKFAEKLGTSNALDIISRFDVVIDGSDNFPTRYLVNDACEILGKPYIYGAIHRFEGQVSVFNYEGSVTYRDLFPEPPGAGMAPNCAEAGVLGVMAGLIGSMQANEAVKVICGFGKPLAGELLILDALTLTSRKFRIPAVPGRERVKELINYEDFCGISLVEEITMKELEKWQSENRDFQLIDVREPDEYEAYNIDGELIPMDEIEERQQEVSRTKPVVIHCQTGIRSKKVIDILKDKFGFSNLINLRGGIY